MRPLSLSQGCSRHFHVWLQVRCTRDNATFSLYGITEDSVTVTVPQRKAAEGNGANCKN